MKHFWVDVDNPPQAQYLSPIARALRERGHSVLLTARDHAPTLEVLANRDETAIQIGGTFGASSLPKVAGTLARAARLHVMVRRRIGQPAAVVSTARSGVLAARTLGAPAFTVLDYEGVELGAFRRSGTVLLHPSVVPAERFTQRGFPAERLHAFPGLKEDLAFSGLDVDVEPVDLPAPRDTRLPAVLIRPPSQTSHYRADASVQALGLVLNRLAMRDDVQVVFSPREATQAEMISERAWNVAPVILERALPLPGLLRAVAWVVTGGGTMLREAAWLGVPGVSVFQGEMPAVDEWLRAEGAIRQVSDAAEAEAIDWSRPPGSSGLQRHPEALEHVTRTVLEAVPGLD
jgi:predicted glycosyltransferase